MDLFEANRRATLEHVAPLSARMRPRNLTEIVGHEDVIGAGTLLRQAIERDQLISLVLWGPPGSGKTTIARLIANETRAHFAAISAVSSGVAELRSIVREAADRLGMQPPRDGVGTGFSGCTMPMVCQPPLGVQTAFHSTLPSGSSSGSGR